MPRVQVVVASRHGATAGIAHRIAEVLREERAEVTVVDAASRPDPADFDAYVIGSAVYMGRWLKEGIEFLERHQSTLASRKVWLFSSGPVPGPAGMPEEADPIALALGPEDGPGSGGRKEVAALAAVIHPLDHEVFAGAFDPNDSPKSMAERLVRAMPAAKNALPSGDFRDWAAIDAWARQIAAGLTTTAAVG